MKSIFKFILLAIIFLFGSNVLAQAQHEILLVIPPDKPENASSDNGDWKDLRSFLKESYQFTPSGIYPRTKEGNLFRIESLEDFESLLRDRLRVPRPVGDNLELSIMFFGHGGLRNIQGEKNLVLWTGPATDQLVPFKTYLTKIQEIIAETSMELRVSLNISVGACHSGQCVADYERHPIRQAPYRTAVFGFVHAEQSIYRNAITGLWEAADRMDRFLQRIGTPLFPQGNQFERWAAILSAIPLWLISSDGSGYYTRTASAGTYLDAHELSLQELVSLGVALPLIKWGSKSYQFIIKELQKKFQESPGDREKFNRLLRTKYMGLAGTEILKYLIRGKVDKAIEAVISASSKMDSHEHISRQFAWWFFSKYLKDAQDEELQLPSKLLLKLRAQAGLMEFYRYDSSAKTLWKWAIDMDVFDLPVVRYLLIAGDGDLIRGGYDYLSKSGRQGVFIEAASVELSQAIEYAEMGESTERYGIRAMFVEMMMSGRDELMQWTENNIKKLNERSTKELENFKSEIVRSLTYWSDPLYQVITLRLAEFVQALSSNEVKKRILQISEKNVSREQRHQFDGSPFL